MQRSGISRITRPLTWAMLAVTATGSLLTSAAAAEGSQESPDVLEEIVVTATKTGPTDLQKTPLALTVLSGDQLDTSGIVNVMDLAHFVPNFSIAELTVFPEIYIRGIGSSNINNGSDPDVTTEVDGVYIARPYAELSDYLDVDRIEVLRGPQGTLYGRNAVGGVINVISKKPSDDFQGEVAATVGDYNYYQTQMYISGPIAPGVLQASLAANYTRQIDGYVKNIYPGGQDLDNANRGGLRGQVRFTPSDSIEAITRFDWSGSHENDDFADHLLAPLPGATLANSIIGNYHETAENFPQFAHTQFAGVSQEINFTINQILALKSLTAARRSSYSESNDQDGTELNLNSGTPWDHDTQFSQEFDLTATLTHFNGVAGLYYFDEDEKSFASADVPPSITTPPPASSYSTQLPVSHAQSYAAFAQVTYHPITEVGITVGVRQTEDKKSLNSVITHTSLNPATLGVSTPGYPVATHAARTFNATTPKFALDWQIIPNIMAYASATEGYKSGGTNPAATDPRALSFAPETLWSYEAGLRSDWFDRRVRVNLTGFHYDYSNLQVQAAIAPGVIAITNAAKSTVNGAELETTAKPTRNLLLTAKYSYLDATYNSFPTSVVANSLLPTLASSPLYNPATHTYNASGNRMIQSPRNTISGSAEYDIDIYRGSLFVRGEYYWQSRVYFDPTNSLILSQPAYGVANFAVGYRDDKWSLELLAKNVTNKQYLMDAQGGFASVGIPGAPRTIQGQVSRRW